MFTKKELSLISEDYFYIVHRGCYSCTVVSKSTSHWWHMLAREIRLKDGGIIHQCVLYHRHTGRDSYHQHSIARDLVDALKMIQKHDQFVLRNLNASHNTARHRAPN